MVVVDVHWICVWHIGFCKSFKCCCFCCRLLIIDNFIPPDDKQKILSRAEFDEEEDTWRLKALAKGGSVGLCVVYDAVSIRCDVENLIFTQYIRFLTS